MCFGRGEVDCDFPPWSVEGEVLADYFERTENYLFVGFLE